MGGYYRPYAPNCLEDAFPGTQATCGGVLKRLPLLNHKAYPNATHPIPNGTAINTWAFWSLNPSIPKSL